MKAIRTIERYTLETDGITAVVEVNLAESDVTLARVTKHYKVEAEGDDVLPPNIAGKKTYKDGTNGFIREDGSMFFLMGGSSIDVMDFDEIIDLGFRHYSESWHNHAFTPAEAA